MSGIFAAVAAGGGGPTAPPATAYSGAKAAGSLTSTITFNADGTAPGSNNGTSTPTDTTHNWFSPTTTNIGASFFLRVTLTAGTPFTTNGAASFTALSAPIMITRFAASGANLTSTYTVEIATDAGGTNIVSTQTLNTLNANGT